MPWRSLVTAFAVVLGAVIAGALAFYLTLGTFALF